MPLWATAGVVGATSLKNVNHAIFAGAEYLRVSSATPTGLDDGKAGTVSFWVKFTGPALTLQRICSFSFGDVLRLNIARSATNDAIVVQGYNSAGTNILLLRGSTGIVAASGWTQVTACWDLATPGSARIYINGVADTLSISTPFTDDFLDYVTPGATRITLGGGFSASPENLLVGGLAQFWFDDSYNNVIADYYAAGKAVPVGANGQLPIGTAPVIYFSAGGTGDSWTTNGGTGGALTKVGTLTTDPSPPQFP